MDSNFLFVGFLHEPVTSPTIGTVFPVRVFPVLGGHTAPTLCTEGFLLNAQRVEFLERVPGFMPEGQPESSNQRALCGAMKEPAGP